MQQVQRPDALLEYEIFGEGSPVTLLHGFTQRGDSWRPLIERVGTPHRWIVPDLRGHGRTTTTPEAPHTMEASTADVVALLEEQGVERTHLVGYSMGGRLALHLAVAHTLRVRSLCVISAHAGLGEHERRVRRSSDHELAARIESEGAAWFAEHWSALPMFESLRRRRPEIAGSLLRARRGADTRGLAASLRQMGAGAMLPLWDALPRVAVPALVLAGDEDERFLGFGRRLRDCLPDARFEVIAAAGHAAHLEQPDVVAAVIDSFLVEVDAAARS